MRQVVKQARSGDAAGVSKRLFAGQSAASIGFIAYSVMLGNWVFIVTNGCILATAVAGQWLHHRRHARQALGADVSNG